MARKDNLKFNIDISQDLYEWADPKKLKKARSKAVEAAGVVWADETKELTQVENHIDTSLYINSIGYVTNFPDTNKSGQGSRQATQADVIHELEESPDTTTLRIGSAVSYADDLEKRFALMNRGLDKAKPRMSQVADYQVKKALGLL